jgi:subtilase family serine protease
VITKRLSTVLGVLALATAGLTAALPNATAAPASEGSHKVAPHVRNVCPATAKAGYVTCDALEWFTGRTLLADPPAGALTPEGLQDAYNLKGLKSHGKTIAIVDAYGYPNLERDLGIFRDYFDLPPCTTKNGCLTILDERGGHDYPPFNSGWAGEQALDVDAVSSACPDCKIIVVQSDKSNFYSIGRAVRLAAAQPGVVAISNSYGGHDAMDSRWAKVYHQPGMAVTASTGDSGYASGAHYPSSSQYVTAVGGTSLTKDASKARGWTESAWSGAGSGCSEWNTKNKASGGFHTSCRGMRAASDVSAAADPSRGGLAWYHPVTEDTSTWGQVGGTSESAPIIASVYALSGNTKGDANRIPYHHTDDLYDVTTGANGSCGGSQICTARKGWDGPTGLGTPNGVGAF